MRHAYLNAATVSHACNAIVIKHCLKAVGHSQQRHEAHCGADGSLDPLISAMIDRCSRLVEQQHARLAK